MRRDDAALAEAAAGHEPAHAVQRTAGYFGEPGLFGWYHRAPAAAPRDCVALLCAPIGPEYTRAHRTLRHLADLLARSGIPALRFDYHGVGDSAGDEDEPDRVAHWRRSIAEAVRHARSLSGAARACLVGVRLGATLAALEAAALRVDRLVLWNPVVRGRTYARELKAIALTASHAQPSGDGAIESAGFRVSTATLAGLRGIDLAALELPKPTQVLLVDRDDLAADSALAKQLATNGIACDRVSAPGWNGMMADHQYTVVPDAALAAIRDWIVAHTALRPPSPFPRATQRTSLPLEGCKERFVRFGPERHLAGIYSEPARASARPAVLLLNAGSIHHVGPYRLYVRLARELAALGYPALRFDLESVGDSVRRDPGRENHPYPPNAMADIEAAIDFLRQDHGCERFVLAGLCSGAYHVFHAGLTLRDAPIERLVLVNPWYFRWREGLSLDTAVNHYESVAAYKTRARDPKRWKRLLTGRADVDRLALVTLRHVAKTVRGRLHDLHETLDPSRGTRLSRDLRAIARMRRPITLFLSDGEPAATVLATEAALATRRMTRSGLLRIERVPGGDHTFSRFAQREDLVARIVRLLETPVSPATAMVTFHA